MAHSTRGGCPSPDLGPACPRPSCCLCPAEGGPGSSGASPVSSPDSCGSLPGSRGWRAGGRARLGGGQRQSASQREKLRMRRLAQALHALRRYLPPSVAPPGQSLTKIETLRLAIRYIGHLSQLLGQEARPPQAQAWPAAPHAPAAAPSCGQGAPFLPPETPACQSLPDELLSFLEDFFPLEAPGRD